MTTFRHGPATARSLPISSRRASSWAVRIPGTRSATGCGWAGASCLLHRCLTARWPPGSRITKARAGTSSARPPATCRCCWRQAPACSGGAWGETARPKPPGRPSRARRSPWPRTHLSRAPSTGPAPKPISGRPISTRWARDPPTAASPSTHMGAAFALVTPFAQHYNAPWLYAVAGATAFGRIQQRQHFASDVVAGGLMGYLAGDLLLDQQKKNRREPRIAIGANRSVTAAWEF